MIVSAKAFDVLGSANVQNGIELVTDCDGCQERKLVLDVQPAIGQFWGRVIIQVVYPIAIGLASLDRVSVVVLAIPFHRFGLSAKSRTDVTRICSWALDTP